MDGGGYKSGEGQIKVGLTFGQIKLSTDLFMRFGALVIDDVQRSFVSRVQ